MTEELLCISYFDDIIGPNVFYCNVPSLSDSDYPNLNRLLDFSEEEGTFIYAFKKFQTLNIIFHIDSEKARGGQHLMMISYMIKASYFKDEILDVYKHLDSKRGFLEEFAEKISKMDGISDILLKMKDTTRELNAFEDDDKSFDDKFSPIYKKYYETISLKSSLKKNKDDKKKKIFVIGSPKSGKSTFLKNIEFSVEYNQSNTGLPTRIFEAFVENIQLLSYDCFEKKNECYQCENLDGCIQNAQGFVIIFDLASIKSLETVNDYFKSILNSCSLIESNKVPILLIGNKFEDKTPLEELDVLNFFNKEQLASCGMKLKFVKIDLSKESALINKSLLWMVKRMI